MKRFLTTLILFLIGIAVLLGLAEWMARSCPNAYSQKQAWMEQHGGEVETLVLGSSHAYAGLQPRHLKTLGYNLANSNQTQRYDWLLLARDSTRLQRLKAIIYPASSLQMNYPLEVTTEWYRGIYYQLYNHLEVHSSWSRYAWETASLKTCCWKVQSLMNSGTSDRMSDDDGWCNFYQASDDNLRQLTDAALQKRLAIYDERATLAIEKDDYFGQIAQFCQRHGIRLILVGMPVSAPFGQQDPHSQKLLEQLDKRAREYAESYPATIEYRNYSTDARFEASDFYDVDHLNSLGARKLTQIISEDFAL